MPTPTFRGGVNIAMKIPAAHYDDTLAFYRDTLGLDVETEPDAPGEQVSRTARVQFGPCTLWLDQVDSTAHHDLWLELNTDDLDAATRHLAAHGAPTRDELEPLPPRAHWVCNPAGVPHILREPPV